MTGKPKFKRVPNSAINVVGVHMALQETADLRRQLDVTTRDPDQLANNRMRMRLMYANAREVYRRIGMVGGDAEALEDISRLSAYYGIDGVDFDTGLTPAEISALLRDLYEGDWRKQQAVG